MVLPLEPFLRDSGNLPVPLVDPVLLASLLIVVALFFHSFVQFFGDLSLILRITFIVKYYARWINRHSLLRHGLVPEIIKLFET